MPALFLGLALGFSGVSYRFGDTCHINHEKSLGAFWIPLLAFTGMAAVLQVVTFAYCIRVYLQNLMDPNVTSENSSKLPSHNNSSLRTASARAKYRRIRKVVAMQWRGVMVVILMIIAVVDNGVVFLKLDAMQTKAQQDPTEAVPWLTCLAANKADKTRCLDKANGVILNEPSILAPLFMIALLGLWCLLFLGRLSMASGWWNFIRSPFRSHEHFVSVDARRLSASNPRNYEMLSSPQQSYPERKSPSGPIISFSKELTTSPPLVADDFTPTEAEFRERKLSFSQPRPPSRAASKSSQRVTFSREGPSSPPLSSATMRDWSSFPEADEEAPAATVVAAAVPQHQRSPLRQQPYDSTALGGASASAWERSPSALSNGTQSGSALGREHAEAALGREWRTPAPRAGGISPSLHRSNSALGRDRDWDYRSTYARGTSPDVANARR